MRGTRPFDRADQLHAFWALQLHLVNVLVTEGHDVFAILESLRYVLCVCVCMCVRVCVCDVFPILESLGCVLLFVTGSPQPQPSYLSSEDFDMSCYFSPLPM